MSLSKELIIQAEDIVLEEVDVPEWGGSVFLVPMTGTERAEVEIENSKHIDNGGLHKDFRDKFLARTLRDAQGRRMFDTIEEGAEILGKKSGAVTNRIFDKSWKLSGFRNEEIKEFEKN